MLHISPEACLTQKFKSNPSIIYLSADILPYAMFEMDITNIFFPDDTFDVVYVSHVLNCIPDDRKAIRELFRVMKPGGWGVLQVPIDLPFTVDARDLTSPDIHGHRIYHTYGKDYYVRLADAGFTVHPQKLPVQNNPGKAARYGLLPGDEIILCRKP